MKQSMIIYGTRVQSDIAFGYDFPDSGWYCSQLVLQKAPLHMMQKRQPCPFWYKTHGREVNLSVTMDQYSGKQRWCYEVVDLMTFYWEEESETIFYHYLDEKGAHLFGFWFVHQLLPLYLAVKGSFGILHGGAVEVYGRGIVLSASSMGGKSTMVDYFIRQGEKFLSDDKVATFKEGTEFMMVGSHPYHRPYRMFETLGQMASCYRAEPIGLNAIYLLERGDDTKICIEPVRGMEKFRQMSMHYLYDFSGKKVQRIAYLSELLNHVPLFRVVRPWGMEWMDEVYRMIKEHIASLPEKT